MSGMMSACFALEEAALTRTATVLGPQKKREPLAAVLFTFFVQVSDAWPGMCTLLPKIAVPVINLCVPTKVTTC